MSSDLIPVIYSLRSKLNETRSLEEQTEALACALLKLERVYSEYDSLDIVKFTKQLLTDELLHDSQDINIKNHIQMRGFEPIRRAIINTQIPASSDLNLLSFNFIPTTNKKQKSGGYSMSFNFDDFPMFETVDSMLEGLRVNVTDKLSLEKILALDLSELIDHPQWEELLETMHRSISIPGQHEIIVMSIYHRFVTGFVGSSQGLDALNEALSYLLAQWVTAPQPHTDSTPDNRKTIARCQLTLFCSILHTSAVSVQVPYQKEADRAVVLIFELLGKGVVPVHREQNFESVSVIEALATTMEQGDAISALLMAIHPFTAFSYAVQTGLLSSLLGAPICSPHRVFISLPAALTRLQIVLSLWLCFGGNADRVTSFVESHMRDEGGRQVFDDSAFLWRGELTVLIADRSNTSSATVPLLVPIDGSNKRFLHLSQGALLMDWWSGEQMSVPLLSSHFLADWVTSKLSQAAALLSGASVEDFAILRGIQWGGVLRRAMVVFRDSAPLASLVRVCTDLLQQIERVQSQTKFVDDALLGYISGLAALFEDSCALQEAHGVHQELSKSVDNLLHRQVFAPGESTHSLETQTAFVRLLCVYVKHPHLVSVDHLSSIVEMCILMLQVALPATGSEILGIAVELRQLLMQALQTTFSEGAYYDTLHTRKFVGPGTAVLLLHLLHPEFSDTHSADCKARCVHAILAVFSCCSTNEIAACLVDNSEVKREVLRVMESEYLDSDAWDRAQDTEQPTSTPFGALFTMLIGLASTGHVSVLNVLFGESWGALIAADQDTNELSDLCLLGVNLCLRRDSAISLSSESVFPYVLRLLHAVQNNALVVAAMREHYVAGLADVPSDGGAADADGTDLTDVFIRLTTAAMQSGVSATRRQELIPRTESELFEFQMWILTTA